ncbi:MAG: RagB/SusD family nutrient uptake outer membrane protein [Chitinophagaceae bacterium]|nr:RagB/SusD family nutrient uptake outer membrane protein [Chitinophagaceae bacterium]
MKKIILLLVPIAVIGLSSCQKFLDRKPLDASSAATFLSNQAEMEQGLNGVYAAGMWVMLSNTPLLFEIEASTDLAMKRVGNASDQVAMGDGGPFLITNSMTITAWNQAFRLVQRANQQIASMENGRDNVPATTFNRLKAEALVLRAWGYLHLAGWFGDVPFYKAPPSVTEVLSAKRTPVATIVAELSKDMDEAAAAFDAAGTTPVQTLGRVNKAVALGIKAKLALLIRDYRTAAAACKTIIDGGQYSLNPNFPNLFSLAGQSANSGREILFIQTYPTDVNEPWNFGPILGVPRQVSNSQSSHFPSQALVDQFEDRSGNRIDASTTYDPANPRLNRDRRLFWSIYLPGDTMVHFASKSAALPYNNLRERTIFNIYSNVRRKFNWNTGVYDNVAGNNDWVGAQSVGLLWQVSATGNIGGVGYVWNKYNDSTQYTFESKVGFILMRYAEILLTYAEAKIELGEIDGTVTGAINAVRARAGQPATTLTSQSDLRTLVRRERAVEFAGEGLRLFDLRRWDIYAKATSVPIVGISLDPAVPAARPVFDADNVPNYASSINQRIRFRGQTRANTNPKYKLWPIPQFEIDNNPGITQNTGW